MGKPAAMCKQILIVDAERGKWEDLKDWLQTEGYPVEHVGDGWRAIEKMRDGRFAVAIISLDLPLGGDLALSSWHLARICKLLDPGISILLIARGYGQELQALQIEELRETISQLNSGTTLQRKGGECRCGHSSFC